MSSTSSTSSTSGTGSTQTPKSTSTDPYSALDTGAFIKLLLTELQNQDPTSPMDNSQILQEVSQIRTIQSTQQLSDTLGSVLLGQNVATGANLMGRQIVALDDSGAQATGTVDKVTIEDGSVKVHIGEQTIDLKNISEIDGAYTYANSSSIADALAQLLGSSSNNGNSAAAT